jgi:hypothetical protein
LFGETAERNAFVAAEPAAMTIEPYIHTNA